MSKKDKPDGFLYFRYFLDIDTRAVAQVEQYLNSYSETAVIGVEVTAIDSFEVGGDLQMQWSKLKKTIECFICPSLKGRVKFYSTRYRSAHDQIGRAWITIDGKVIYNFSTPIWIQKFYGTVKKIREENNNLDFNDPLQSPGYYDAYKEAQKFVEENGIFEQYFFYKSLREYINLPFEEALESENKIIKSLSLIDKRLGKRRLELIKINDDDIHLFKTLYYLRMESEGLKVK